MRAVVKQATIYGEQFVLRIYWMAHKPGCAQVTIIEATACQNPNLAESSSICHSLHPFAAGSSLLTGFPSLQIPNWPSVARCSWCEVLPIILSLLFLHWNVGSWQESSPIFPGDSLTWDQTWDLLHAKHWLNPWGTALVIFICHFYVLPFMTRDIDASLSSQGLWSCDVLRTQQEWTKYIITCTPEPSWATCDSSKFWNRGTQETFEHRKSNSWPNELSVV